MQYQRIRKLIDIELLKKKTITIVGLGSLGSFTALLLAKNGVNLNLIDFDKVSIENLSSQDPDKVINRLFDDVCLINKENKISITFFI